MFFGDVVMCVVYLRNRSPSHALSNKSLYEMCEGHIPLVRHLKVFGSTHYALIPNEKRNKLGAKS